MYTSINDVKCTAQLHHCSNKGKVKSLSKDYTIDVFLLDCERVNI